MAARDYKQLIAWQKAMDLVVTVYELTKLFPKEEVYGLTAQLRRAAVSIPSNIAEGQGRRTTNDFLHFLGIAYGSLAEVETQLMIAQRLNYCVAANVMTCLDLGAEVGRLLNGLMNSLDSSQ